MREHVTNFVMEMTFRINIQKSVEVNLRHDSRLVFEKEISRFTNVYFHGISNEANFAYRPNKQQMVTVTVSTTDY